MQRDIVSAEAELSIAANKVQAQAELISTTIEQYIHILSQIQEIGIQDDLICAELSKLANSVQPYKRSIKGSGDDISADVRSYIDQIAAADNFVFPGDIIETIRSLIAQFM